MDKIEPVLRNLLAWLHQFSIEQQWSAFLHQLAGMLADGDWKAFAAAATTGFVLIATAEIGDKSQLVCMTLASKHKPWPVLFGASAAFALLNTLAVVFGAAIARWLPEFVVAVTVALLFALFGFHALRAGDDDDEDVQEKSGHGIFFTTFLLITVAEFGDKTQLAVVALSSTSQPLAVWFGATLALTATSAFGVLAGRTILQKFPLAMLHRFSGVFFLALAAAAAYRAYETYTPQVWTFWK